MKLDEYHAWLEEVMSITKRGANDVVSRLRRAMKLLDVNTIDETTIDALIANLEFQSFNSVIKSQIKRAVSLYLEFSKGLK